MLKTFNFSKLKHITIFLTTGEVKEIVVNEKMNVAVDDKGLLVVVKKTTDELERAKEKAIEKVKENFTGKWLEEKMKEIEEDRNKYPKGMVMVSFIPFSAIEQLDLFFAL